MLYRRVVKEEIVGSIDERQDLERIAPAISRSAVLVLYKDLTEELVPSLAVVKQRVTPTAQIVPKPRLGGWPFGQVGRREIPLG